MRRVFENLVTWIAEKVVVVKDADEHPDWERRVKDGKEHWGVARGRTIYMPLWEDLRDERDRRVMYAHEFHHVKQWVASKFLFWRRFSDYEEEVAAHAVAMVAVNKEWGIEPERQAGVYSIIMASDHYPSINQSQEHLYDRLMDLYGTGRLFA